MASKPLTFGKRKGKTLEEIHDIDKSYLEWLMVNHSKKDFRMKCAEVYKEKSKFTYTVTGKYRRLPSNSWSTNFQGKPVVLSPSNSELYHHLNTCDIKPVLMTYDVVLIHGKYERVPNSYASKWVGSRFETQKRIAHVGWDTDFNFTLKSTWGDTPITYSYTKLTNKLIITTLDDKSKINYEDHKRV